MTVVHEARATRHGDAADDARKTALLRLLVAHVLVVDELLKVGDEGRRVLLLRDEVEVRADDDDRGVGGASLPQGTHQACTASGLSM